MTTKSVLPSAFSVKRVHVPITYVNSEDSGEPRSLGRLRCTLEPKLLYLPQKRLEVTSSAIVVLTAFFG